MSDLVSVKPTGSERFCFDLVSTQLWLCMAPKKRSSTGAVKTAFVDIKDVKPGQTVSVKGKVLSKSGTMTFGDMLWNCGVLRERGWESLQKRALHMVFLLCALPSSLYGVSQYGFLVKPRISRSGTLWAWVDVQDCEKGNLLRLKAFGDQTKQIIALNFLDTYNSVWFQCEVGGQGQT